MGEQREEKTEQISKLEETIAAQNTSIDNMKAQNFLCLALLALSMNNNQNIWKQNECLKCLVTMLLADNMGLQHRVNSLENIRRSLERINVELGAQLARYEEQDNEDQS